MGSANSYFPGGKGESGWPAISERRPSSLRRSCRASPAPSTRRSSPPRRRRSAPRSPTRTASSASPTSCAWASTRSPASAPRPPSSAPPARRPTTPSTRSRARPPAWSARAGSRSSPAAGPGSWRPPTAGRRDAGACSIGLNIELPFEQGGNPYCDICARVPLLLRAQDHVRALRERLRGLPGRLRHDGRAVRGAHADPDGEDHRVPRGPRRDGLLARTRGLARASACSPRGRSRPDDLELFTLTDDPAEVRDLLMSAAHRQARA